MPANSTVALGLLFAVTAPAISQEVGGGNYPYEQFLGTELGQRMGYSVANAGDVNNDGKDDYIIGAIGTQVAHMTEAGAAYVYSGADGSLLHTFTGPSPGARFGFSVDGAGDVDGDGYDDVIIGAPYVGPVSSPNEGRAYVYSGADGHRIHRFDGAAADYLLGFSVSGAGDVNGDGLADVIVGSIWCNESGLTESGAADLYSGANGQPLYHWDGGSPRDYFGYSVSEAGDVNNDGVPDVMVGVPGANPNGLTDAGRVFVYSGADGKKIHRIDGTNAFDWFGFSVAPAGDLNMDGYDDIFVGSPLADANGNPDSGSAIVYSGKNINIMRQYHGTAEYQNFGSAVAGGQDMNRDGTTDFLVGAPGADPGGEPYAGSATAISGTDGSHILQFWGTMSGDQLGHDVAMLPNLYPYAHSEILVGAHGLDVASRVDAGWAGVVGFSRYIRKEPHEISATDGGLITFELQFPQEYAQKNFKLLGSASGEGPSELAGLEIPLTQGDFLWDALLAPMPPPLFSNVNGILSAAGEAQCLLNLPAGFASSYVGRDFYFAAVIYEPPASGLVSSAVTIVTVIP